MNLNDWSHKEEWRRSTATFSVVVSRHSVEVAQDSPDRTGPFRWAIYAYIYPTHPTFAAFSGSDLWQTAAMALPLHAGPSLLHWHYSDALTPTSVQIGADYNHLYDDWATYCETPDDALTIFHDVQVLYDHLAAKQEHCDSRD